MANPPRPKPKPQAKPQPIKQAKAISVAAPMNKAQAPMMKSYPKPTAKPVKYGGNTRKMK